MTTTDTEQPVDEEDNISKGINRKDSVEDSSIPTLMDIFYDFNGSLGFVVGSSGFILSMYFTDWLPYFRYGSLVWIYGCVMYSIPLFLKFRGWRFADRCPWGIGDFGGYLCYLFFVIGCILGGFFDEATVESFLPPINHTFLYGSFSLTLEPIYQGFLFLRRGGSFRSRMGATKLCGSSTIHEDSNNDDDESVVTPLKINWDRFLELSATTFYCAAAVFGGFPPHPSLALPGVYFWEVGSLFSLARSFFMLYQRNQGLKTIVQEEQ